MTARLGSWHRALITWEQSRFTVVQQAYQARESRLERLRGPFVKPLQMPFALHVLKPRWVLYGVGYSLNCVFVLVFWWAKRVWWCPVPRPGLAERYLQATRMLRAENFDRTLFVSVMSLKGGIGKTTLTLLLAIFLRRKRTELVTVVQDCNEDDGTLGDRIRRTTRLSMRDAVKALSSIKRLPDLMRFCNRTKSGVLVLAMNGPVDDTDEAASAWRVSREELEDLHTRHEALTSVVVCDLGTNTTSPSNLAAMARTEQVVIPTTPARDSVTQALKTFNFMLNSNRHDQRLAARAIIVINLWSPLWMPFVSPSRIRKRFVDKYGEERLSGVTFVTVSMVVWLALGLHITPRVLLPRQRVQFSELCAMIAHGANSFNQDNPSSS